VQLLHEGARGALHGIERGTMLNCILDVTRGYDRYPRIHSELCMIFGNLISITQKSMKRMLATSMYMSILEA
jgi:hypothetical protein